MAREGAESQRSCRTAAVVSGVVLLLAVVVAQHHSILMQRAIVPEYRRLKTYLPTPTLALVVKYPAAPGYLAIAAAGAWLVAAFLLRRHSVTVIVNCCLLLAVLVYLVLHEWASVLPYAAIGRT